MHQRLCRPQHARLPGRNQAAGRNRAQVDQLEIVAAGDDENPSVEKAVARVRLFLDCLIAEQRGEDRRAVRHGAHQRLDSRPAEPFDLSHRQERLEFSAGLEEQRHVAGNQNRARVVAGAEARDLVRVIAPVGKAVERIGGEAETIEPHQRHCANRPLKDSAP